MSTFYRSWIFPTDAHELVVLETQRPNMVRIKIGDQAVDLTREQFNALARLASYSSSGDCVRFTEETAE